MQKLYYKLVTYILWWSSCEYLAFSEIKNLNLFLFENHGFLVNANDIRQFRIQLLLTSIK